jgi:hypothetical protein
MVISDVFLRITATFTSETQQKWRAFSASLMNF